MRRLTSMFSLPHPSSCPMCNSHSAPLLNCLWLNSHYLAELLKCKEVISGLLDMAQFGASVHNGQKDILPQGEMYVFPMLPTQLQVISGAGVA